MTAPTTSCGHVDARFAPVRDDLHELLSSWPTSSGGAVAVCVDQRVVVDYSVGAHWRPDSRVVVWSVSKGVVMPALQVLWDRNLLDIESPIARYWPEFGAAGKAHITVGDLLAHTSGLPYWEHFESTARLRDAAGWDRPRDIAAAIAAAPTPIATGAPGVYHSLTFGWLVDELVLRISGQDSGELFRDVIAGPLGLNTTFGGDYVSNRLPLSLEPPPATRRAEFERIANPDTITGKAFMLTSTGDVWRSDEWANHPRFLAAPQPAVNAVTDARSLAVLYGCLASGGAPIVSTRSVEMFATERWRGVDPDAGVRMRRALGYARSTPDGLERFAPTEDAFGHPGMGGSVGFAIPEAALGFGFVTDRMVMGDESRIANQLAETAMSCLK